MENKDLETKYQKLASEYSKIRSQAGVLKKAVVDEQITIKSLKEMIKEQELKIRKHDQEMESLTFRNEQLTKRIGVLQQELHSPVKKGKGKNETVNTNSMNFSVIDEELHKKINENASLLSELSDKELELGDYKERVELFEKRFRELQEEFTVKSIKYIEEIESFKTPKGCNCKNQNDQTVELLKEEVKRWKTEVELLKSKPVEDAALVEYYEMQIRSLLNVKLEAQTEASSLWAENEAITFRLEQALLEKSTLENKLDSSLEELNVTNENYKGQLDAMTEHLAAQNEKITQQCDEIQILKHKLSIKK